MSITISNVIEVASIINEASSKLTMIVGAPVVLDLVTPEIPGVRFDRQLIEAVNVDFTKHLIIGAVCEQFMTNIAAMRGPSVREPLPDARKIITLLLIKFVKDVQASEIAELLNRDDSTISWQHSSAKKMLTSDDGFLFQYNQCLKKIRQEINNG